MRDRIARAISPEAWEVPRGVQHRNALMEQREYARDRADAVIEELRDPTDEMWKAIFGLWLSPMLQRLRIRKWNRVIDAMKGGEK